MTGIPYYADGAQVCHTGSWHVGVSPQTKNLELSVAIAKFFAGPEGSKIWYDDRAPAPGARRSAQHAAGVQRVPAAALQRGTADIGIPRIQTPGYTEYQQIFAELAQDVANGEGVEVAPLVQDAAVQMEQALAKYEGWQEE